VGDGLLVSWLFVLLLFYTPYEREFVCLPDPSARYQQISVHELALYSSVEKGYVDVRLRRCGETIVVVLDNHASRLGIACPNARRHPGLASSVGQWSP